MSAPRATAGEPVICARPGCFEVFQPFVRPGPKKKFCDDPICVTERAAERKDKEREKKRAVHQPRTNLWDPVAKREIAAKHGRGGAVAEPADGMQPGEKNSLAREANRRRLGHEERIGCRACTEEFLMFGRGSACAVHRGRTATDAAFERRWAPLGVTRDDYDTYVAALEKVARIKGAARARKEMSKIKPPPRMAPIIALPERPAPAPDLRVAA